MNKKLLKSIVCIAAGVGIASSIPFTTTSCGCSSSQDDDVSMNPLPEEVYDHDGANLNGFKSEIDWTKYNMYNTIQIPDSITNIDASAFSDNKVPVFIKHLIIAEKSKLSRINPSAFKNCSALTSISFKCNLSTITTAAFMNCSNLSSITWDAWNGTTYFNTTSFANVSSKGTVKVTNPIDSYNSAALLAYLKTKGLPDGWTIA